MVKRYSMWCAVSHGHQMTEVDMGPSAVGGYVTWEDHCAAIREYQSIITDRVMHDREKIAQLWQVAESGLCEGCPPVGYPTDETRCTPCPRRSSLSDGVEP